MIIKKLFSCIQSYFMSKLKTNCHFAPEKVQQNLISVRYIKIGEQRGNVFTKALNGAQIDYM